ncbi:hypothetical protein Lal_00012140 [Lupinus albus]|nr:hypothetical protein Lal_00012140 [Lupinus albus]
MISAEHEWTLFCRLRFANDKALSSRYFKSSIWHAHGAPGLAGGGGIFRDYQGAYIGGFAAFFGVKDSLFVDLKAAIMEIEIAHHKGWRNIWLECDSAMVVDIFNGKGYVS